MVFMVSKMDFQYRLPGKHGKEQYHLALIDLHRNYGPLVREVCQKGVQRIITWETMCSGDDSTAGLLLQSEA